MAVPDHEKLFDEICNKLNELSRTRAEEEPVQPNHEKIDRLQSQVRKFQSDLEDAQSEMREKIKALENVRVGSQGDVSEQLRVMTDQLNSERAVNSKLNADLAKSLELGLQLQLEIQGLKTRSQQQQHEERKFSQTLQEKVRTISHDLELTKALREETETELMKARSRFMDENAKWQTERETFAMQSRSAQSEKEDLLKANDDLLAGLKAKDEEIAALSNQVETLGQSFGAVEASSLKQNEAMRNLSEIAENKIVELKIALDRKTAESRDFEGHLQQALTQAQLLKQENANLKDYIAKVNAYLQSSTAAVSSPASSIDSSSRMSASAATTAAPPPA